MTSYDCVQLVSVMVVAGVAWYALVTAWAAERASQELGRLIESMAEDLAEVVCALAKTDPGLLRRAVVRAQTRLKGRLEVLPGGKGKA